MTNIENSRNCLRRIIHDDKEFSNQSIINVIERFVKSVNMMEETILIPSRLMDRQVGDATDSVKPAVEKTYHHHHHHHHNKKKSSNNIHDCLGNTDLFNLYSMLNSVKVDLLWGRNGQEEETTETNNKKNEQSCENNNTRTDVVNVTETNNQSAPQQQQQTTNTATTDSRKGGHVRHPSTVSLSSSNSSTISDSESEVSSNENDSGIESENQKNKDRCLEVANHFRTHLLGLYKSLEQMTEAASYLTARYQSDMGGC